MKRQPQLTPQTMKVIQAVYDEPGSSGADICRAAGLPSGTVYPILARLEDAGWLGSAWETGDPAMLGRPRKRFYHLTGDGARHARDGAREVTTLFGRLAF
jgi:PadR family transcriptional regulator, regulatory protein PadR